MKLKKGLSFFHATTTDKITFCICLSTKADEDGLIKVFRTDAQPTRHEAATSPLHEVALIVYDPNLMFDWTSEVVRDVISPKPVVSTPINKDADLSPSEMDEIFREGNIA